MVDAAEAGRSSETELAERTTQSRGRSRVTCMTSAAVSTVEVGGATSGPITEDLELSSMSCRTEKRGLNPPQKVGIEPQRLRF